MRSMTRLVEWCWVIRDRLGMRFGIFAILVFPAIVGGFLLLMVFVEFVDGRADTCLVVGE